MTEIAYDRQLAVFDPGEHGDKCIFVVGAGATGSAVALALAKIGCKNITVWDYDLIEEHNIPNQMYGPQHVGMQKVDACKEVVKYLTGTDIKTRDEAFTGQESADIIFILTDTMKSRKEIWNNLKSELWDLIVETRMGTDTARLYAIKNEDPQDQYEETLYDDDDAIIEVSTCGTAITVGPTALNLASLAVWAFIEFCSEKSTPPNETIFSVRGEKEFLETTW